MSIMRWETFGGLRQLREEMNRMWEDFFSGGPFLARRREGPGLRAPAVDVAETETEVVLKAELPGVTRDKLDIEVLPDSVSIKAETSEEKEIKEENYYRRERVHGSFQRVVPMPVEVKHQQAKATLRDGLLQITIPKAEAAMRQQPTKVKVEE